VWLNDKPCTSGKSRSSSTLTYNHPHRQCNGDDHAASLHLFDRYSRKRVKRLHLLRLLLSPLKLAENKQFAVHYVFTSHRLSTASFRVVQQLFLRVVRDLHVTQMRRKQRRNVGRCCDIICKRTAATTTTAIRDLPRRNRSTCAARPVFRVLVGREFLRRLSVERDEYYRILFALNRCGGFSMSDLL